MRPPSSDFGLSRPSTTLASVTVGARAAAPVRRRPRIRARALRPDLEQAAGIDPRDRAAARADGVDVERARAHRKAAHLAFAFFGRLAVADQAHIGARCRPCRR